MKNTDNELIAEFMGIPRLPITNDFVWDMNRTGKVIYSLHSKYLRYHESWDWLMPVVEKIESTPVLESDGIREYMVTIEKPICIISENGENPVIECQRFDTRIENTYHACIDFIKWYNETKQP